MDRDLFKLILGGIVLLGLLALASAIALGHVEEKTSYGLTAVLALLGKVVLDFSQWAYGTYHKPEPRENEPPSKPEVPPQ